MKKLFLIFSVCGACASAAGPGGPVPGYVLDNRTATVRAVYGIPGALQLSSPVALPFGVASAGFGPAGDFVIAVNDQQPAHAFLIQAMASASPVLTDLGAVPDRTRVVAVNGTGTAALLLAGEGTAVQFITGLPESPSLSAPVSTGGLAGAITVAVLDDAGACAIAGTGAVETLCVDGSTQRIVPQTNLNVAALALVNQGRDLVVADGAAKQILLISHYRQPANATVIAGASDGVITPVGLQSIATGQILAADSGAQAVLVIDPAGQQPVRSFALNISPTQLQPLSDRSILLLNDPSAMPFTIMDLSTMQTFFIPAN